AAAAKKEFKAALDLVGQGRARRTTPEWTGSMDRLDRETRESASTALTELKAKAVAARDRGAGAELEAIQAEVRRWQLPELAAELPSALAQAWTTICDGRSTAWMSPPSAPYWKADGAGLTQAPGQPDPQSGQSKDEYGDGEYRFRVSLRGVGQFYVAVRQTGQGACKSAFSGPVLQGIGDGDHELILRTKGGELSATLDGRPCAASIDGKPHPKGRIMVNAKDGVFKLLSVEYRPLP
ncbi:MAG: hypothetical protein JO332_10220, partial [Planctomycetaceae bacterium]|nr:hypothetical protein [Planctomycetaceae bacterium]